MHRMITIGLTGGIASGKSNVAKYLSSFGAKVLDADKIGHSVYEPNTDAYRQVVSTFGPDVVNEADSTIDRRKLGAMVFGNPTAMKKLTDIVWPAIQAKAKEALEDLRKEGQTKVAVLEAAVLLEAQWQSAVDVIWVTVVPKDVAVRRLTSRNALSEEDALKRINSQISNEERVKAAHVVIDTDGPFEQTYGRVLQAWNDLLKHHDIHMTQSQL